MKFANKNEKKAEVSPENKENTKKMELNVAQHPIFLSRIDFIEKINCIDFPEIKKILFQIILTVKVNNDIAILQRLANDFEARKEVYALMPDFEFQNVIVSQIDKMIEGYDDALQTGLVNFYGREQGDMLYGYLRKNVISQWRLNRVKSLRTNISSLTVYYRNLPKDILLSIYLDKFKDTIENAISTAETVFLKVNGEIEKFIKQNGITVVGNGNLILQELERINNLTINYNQKP